MGVIERVEGFHAKLQRPRFGELERFQAAPDRSSASPGPKNERREALPGVPSALGLKAADIEIRQPIAGIAVQIQRQRRCNRADPGCDYSRRWECFPSASCRRRASSVTGKPELARVMPESSQPLVKPFAWPKKRSKGSLILVARDEIVRQIESRKRARGARNCKDCRDRKCSTPGRSTCCRYSRSGNVRFLAGMPQRDFEAHCSSSSRCSRRNRRWKKRGPGRRAFPEWSGPAAVM